MTSDTIESKFELMPHQTEALGAINQAEAGGEGKMLLEMATGLGKTAVSAKKVASVLEHDSKARVMYLCHRVGILKQSIKEFEKIVGNEVEYGLVADGFIQSNAQVLFVGFQALNSRRVQVQASKILQSDYFDTIVADESHHGKADTYEPLIKQYDPRLLIGKTAVPNRMDGRDISDIFGKTVYRKTLPDGIRESLLAPFLYSVHSDTVREGDYAANLSPGQFNRTFFIPKRDKEIVSIFAEELESIDNPHGLIFCKSIEQAERMYRLMADALPHNVAPIHSAQNRKVHDYLVKAFYEGDLQLATVVDEYNEGMDVPSLNFLGFLRNTASEAVWLSQLGRGLRKADGKTSVRVVDLAASLERITMIRNLKNSINSQPSTQKKEIIDIYPRANFEFSKEVEDVVDLAETVRKKVELKKEKLRVKQQEKAKKKELSDVLPLTDALARAFKNGYKHEGKGIEHIHWWQGDNWSLRAQRPLKNCFYDSQIGEIKTIILFNRATESSDSQGFFYLQHKNNRMYRVHSSKCKVDDLYDDAKEWFLPGPEDAVIKEVDFDEYRILEAFLNFGSSRSETYPQDDLEGFIEKYTASSQYAHRGY